MLWFTVVMAMEMSEVEQTIEKAQTALVAEDAVQVSALANHAEEQLALLVEEQGKTPKNQFVQARIDGLQKQPDAAIAALDWIVAEHPNHEAAWHLRGELLTARAPREGVRAYEEAVEELPNSQLLWADLGDTREAIGENAEALKAFEKATSSTNNTVAFHAMEHLVLLCQALDECNEQEAYISQITKRFGSNFDEYPVYTREVNTGGSMTLTTKVAFEPKKHMGLAYKFEMRSPDFDNDFFIFHAKTAAPHLLANFPKKVGKKMQKHDVWIVIDRDKSVLAAHYGSLSYEQARELARPFTKI